MIRQRKVSNCWGMMAILCCGMVAVELRGASPYESFDTARSLPQAADLRGLFEVIAGQPQGIFETRSQRGQCAGIEGLVRLRVPWPEQGVWRFALEQYDGLQFHFFRGVQGVSLVYLAGPLQQWVAYQTTREPGAVTPSSWVLAATDDHRHRRTFPRQHGHYAVEVGQGAVRLLRGDIELVTAHLGGLPEQVYCQGRATILGMSGPTAESPRVRTTTSTTPRDALPMSGPWREQLPARAKWLELPGGGRRLESPGAPVQKIWVARPWPIDTLGELRLEITDAQPGAGIYLGNGRDGPRAVLRYVRDRRTNHLCLTVRGDDDRDEVEFAPLLDAPLPAVAPRHWIKIIRGAGVLRWAISPDGISWAEPSPPLRDFPSEATHWGLHCVQRREPTGLTLLQAEFVPFQSLQNLVPPAVLAQATSIPARQLTEWQSKVHQNRPSTVDSATWEQACLLKTIASGVSPAVGSALLEQLLNTSCGRLHTPEAEWQLLDAVVQLHDHWDNTAAADRLLIRYLSVAAQPAESAKAVSFSTCRVRWMTAPIATRVPLEFSAGEAMTRELLHRLHTRPWPDVAEFARELRYFQLSPQVPLLDWGETVAHRSAPREAASAVTTRAREEWRDMLVEELNKDVYDALTQLRVELAGSSRTDAAAAIAALRPEWDRGLAPDPQDPALLLALPTAVREIVDQDAGLSRAISAGYEETAFLRWRQALDQNSPPAASRILWQFAPTKAAAAAKEWLEKRRSVTSWPKQPASSLQDPEAAAVPRSPLFRERIETLVGNDPYREFARGTAALKLDWPGRQIGVTADDGALYVCNRFQVLALDLGSHRRRWRSSPPSGQIQFAQESTFIPSRPLVIEDRVFVRLLFSSGATLAALDRDSGQFVWTTSPPLGEEWISDPFHLNGELACLSWVRTEQQDGDVRLSFLDPQTGYVWRQRRVLRLRESWRRRRCCQIVAHSDGATIMLGGVLAEIDCEGEVRWIRKQLALPADDDQHWVRQAFEPPLQEAGSLWVVFPGGRTVDCVATGTGRLLWSQLVPDIERLVGVSETLVVGQTSRGLSSWKRTDGELVWEHTFSGAPACVTWKDQKHLVALQRVADDRDATIFHPKLVWLELSTGQVVYSQELVYPWESGLRLGPAFHGYAPLLAAAFPPSQRELRLGPLMVVAGRLWTFWGHGQNEASRDLVELAPSDRD